MGVTTANDIENTTTANNDAKGYDAVSRCSHTWTNNYLSAISVIRMRCCDLAHNARQDVDNSGMISSVAGRDRSIVIQPEFSISNIKQWQQYKRRNALIDDHWSRRGPRNNRRINSAANKNKDHTWISYTEFLLFTRSYLPRRLRRFWLAELVTNFVDWLVIHQSLAEWLEP